MKKSICTSLAFILLFCSSLIGQQSINDQRASYTLQKVDNQVSLQDFLADITSALNINDKDLVLLKERHTEQGYTHQRYKQYYKGLEVVGGEYNIHLKNGLVDFVNGSPYPDINIDVNITPPSTSKLKDLLIKNHFSTPEEAMQYFDAAEVEITSSEKVIADEAYPQYSGQYKVLYKVKATYNKPFDKKILLVDPIQNRIVHEQSTICAVAIEGTGTSRNYGEVTFIVDSLAPGQYDLYDPIRDIRTYSQRTGLNLPYTDDDNVWSQTNENKDEVAIDAHYCTSKFHDMMVRLFDWEGLDGEGLGFHPVVHANMGLSFLNAFWDGQNAYFGNGDCHHHSLATLSVVGHEFMHGITDYTSDLIYANESGGINESMSDIFGKSLEYFEDPSRFSWDLGPSFAKSQYSRNFRSMATPNEYNAPSYYRGEYWDYGGAVHTNSGVFNHWFYLMVEGQSGTNEVGYAYNVESMPIEDVLQVVFRTQRDYLNASSTIPELYELSLQSTIELYGAQSQMMESVVEAWKTVGLPVSNTVELRDLAAQAFIEDRITCETNAPYDVVYEILNSGNTTYDAGSSIMVNIDNNGDDVDTTFTYVLSEDLLPGQTVFDTLRNLWVVTETGFSFFRVEILDEDDLSDNNSDFGFFRNYVDTEPNLDFRDFDLVYDKCFSNTATVTSFVRNESCGELPAGSAITIEIFDDGTLLDTRNITIEDGLAPGGGTGIQFDIELETIQGFLTVNARPIGVNGGLIDGDLFVTKTPTVTGTYYSDMNDFTFIDDFEIENFSGNPLTEYQSETFYGFFGSSSRAGRVPCPETAENLDLNNSQGQSAIIGCIDLTGIDDPVFTFDLAQFRYDSPDYPDLIDNGSIVRVTVEDQNPIVKDLLAGLPEGEINNYQYPLPSGFKGKIEVEFFGHFNDFDPNAPLDYDANLIDNFTIKASTDTEDPIQYKLMLMPNPTRDIVQFATDTRVKYIDIIQPNGMRSKASFDNHTIDLSTFSTGLYFIEFNFIDGGKSMQKIMKI